MIRKTVIITGASGDIGKAIAEKFASNGYNLALCSNKNSIEYDENLAEKFGVDVKTYNFNQADLPLVSNSISQIFKDFKSVDTIVLNAGIAQKRKLIIDVSDNEIDDLIDTNLKGTIACVREFVKNILSKKSGKIILNSSFVANYGCACESVYSASKSAMIGFAKSLSNELGNFDITCNVVCPGFIDTKMNNNLSTAEKEDIESITPLQRLGTVEDVANAIFFLASDDANFITGQVLSVDGGYIPL